MGDQNRDPNQKPNQDPKQNDPNQRPNPNQGTTPQRQAGQPSNPGQQRSGHEDKDRRDDKGGQGGQR